ncbi:hypothetical protein J6Z19_07505 [bacterium]|nr:hypothetical protein [bacterium]
MKVRFGLLIGIFTALVLVSCGGDDVKPQCKENSDCPIGQVCSLQGTCFSTSQGANEQDDNDNGGGELPDSNGNSSGDDTDVDSGSSSADNDVSDPASESDDKTDEKDDSDDNSVTDTDTDPQSDSEPVTDTDTNPQPDTDTNPQPDTDTEPQPDTDTNPQPDDGPDVEINDYDELEITADDDVEFCPTSCPNLILDDGCKNKMDSEYNPALCDTNPPSQDCLCNGLDDDCDGNVDEGCPCTAGQTQACFNGKPNQRNVGTCSDGVQNCQVVMRDGKLIGKWGACKGAILPKKDLCDKADNNCNGCADEGLCCSPKIDCSYDIGTAIPFADKLIDGTKIYDPTNEYHDADKATWEWTLTKGPCDVVLGKTSFSLTSAVSGITGASTNSSDSVTFSGVGLSKFNVNFQLSGTYNLHLKVTRENGEVYECEWKLKVVSDGLRIELCWDTTGYIDIDLHLGKNGVTSSWTDTSACYYADCKTTEYNNSSSEIPWSVGSWNYPQTNSTTPNPRLDIDNIDIEGVPENINIDNPKDGDTFRVLVRYYRGNYESEGCSGSYVDSPTHPVVNVYCGGTLKATYGESPQYMLDSDDDSWKVTEIRWIGGVGSDECKLTPNLNVTDGEVPSYSNW